MSINKMMSNILVSFCLVCLSSFALAATSEAPVYNNMFIAYYSPSDVTAMTQYIKQQKLAGVILWEFRGDKAYDSNASLLKAAAKGLEGYRVDGVVPFIMGYWSDWSLYSQDPSTRAIPEPAYPVPGSYTNTSKTPVRNADFSAKLEGMNVVAYSFVQAQTKQLTYYDNTTGKMVTIENKTPQDIGTLYFNDPWADLTIPGDSKNQDTLCESNPAICWFVLQNRYAPVKPAAGAKMGNFNAFAALKHANKDNPLGPLRKVISVGGYGHDEVFEDTFDTANGTTNFVSSAIAIMRTYNIDGIDLDYENPAMTHQQSQQFLQLIKDLRQAIDKELPGKIISVTVLSDPTFLAGTRNGNNGFAKDVLKEISANADHINLMTYDYHGAFDYNPDGSGTTGFLTNLTIPNDAPKNYRFSVETSVAEAFNQGIPAAKLSIGIPAYGRALTAIDSANGGLYATLTANATIPRGDLDAKSCNIEITSLGLNSCSGSFQYKYIVDKMLQNGFTETKRQDDDKKVAVGTTAYADTWSPAMTAGYSLDIKSDDSNTLAFNINISNDNVKFTAPDFFTAGTAKSYGPQATGDINNQTDLKVNWTTSWGPKGQCPVLLSFKKDMSVEVTIVPNTTTGEYKTSCTFK